MKPTWTFYKQAATDPIRNPISGEFFSQEAVGEVADAIVREGIQNSLDARTVRADGSREVARVRIFLSGADKALSARSAAYWFDTLWPHVAAPGNGLRNQPNDSDNCPFIAFEDFGTTGLSGDTDAHEVVPGIPNNFLNFFRAEGHSDKGSEDRGSWGVGKTVFPRASRISSFYGLTIRDTDNKGLLLGRSILKFHRVGSTAYKSDGYWGFPRSKDGFVLAADGRGTLEQFRMDFNLSRAHEPGLSLVVPYYDVDGDEEITTTGVIGAVLRGFFYPILLGHLEVTVEDANGTHKFTTSTLLDQVRQHMASSDPTLLAVVNLAVWALQRKAEDHLELSPPEALKAQAWAPDLIPDDVLEALRAAVSKRERVALRVPMTVRPKAGDPQPTNFRVYLEQAEDPMLKPTFIRDELIITSVKSPRVPQLRSLVLVEDKPLANLLRDAETPAHTQWSTDTANFKSKYTYGPGVIRFVSTSVAEIARIVRQAQNEPDPLLTIDFFSLPATPDDSNAVPVNYTSKPTDRGDELEPTVPPIPKRPQQFRLATRQAGFSIKKGDPKAGLPKRIEIQVAYDLRRGNPLKKYHTADFDLAQLQASGRVLAKGMNVLSAKDNEIVVEVLDPDFHLDVEGFDFHRDLYVKAKAVEAFNAD